MFAKLADTVMKHSKAIIAIWVVIFILCVPFMLRADSVLEYELTKMTGRDSESAQGNAYMDQYFTNKVDMDEVLVVKYDTAVPEQATAVNTLATSIGNLLKTRYGTNADSSAKVTLTNVGSYTNTGEGADTIGVMIFSIKTTDDSIKFADETGHVRDTVAQAKSETGVNLSIVLIFTLLALFFGAIVTAIVPPLGFGAAYAVAMVVLFHFASTTSVFYLTSTLMVVTMLGAGCDYGLFIITRYREELKNGAAQAAYVDFGAPPVSGVSITEVDASDDRITLKNTSDSPVDLLGCYLYSDRGDELFVFPDETIEPGATLTVGTNSTDGDFDLLWDDKKVVHRKKEDTIGLFDPWGRIVDSMGNGIG